MLQDHEGKGQKCLLIHLNTSRNQDLDLRPTGDESYKLDELLKRSHMVEIGGKQYKAHFCGAGMRWRRKGAECLLPIRTAILSKRYDKMWELSYNPPPT